MALAGLQGSREVSGREWVLAEATVYVPKKEPDANASGSGIFDALQMSWSVTVEERESAIFRGSGFTKL
jgi:hypothetical protein